MRRREEKRRGEKRGEEKRKEGKRRGEEHGDSFCLELGSKSTLEVYGCLDGFCNHVIVSIASRKPNWNSNHQTIYAYLVLHQQQKVQGRSGFPWSPSWLLWFQEGISKYLCWDPFGESWQALVKHRRESQVSTAQYHLHHCVARYNLRQRVSFIINLYLSEMIH